MIRSHDLSEIEKICQHVAILDKGKLVTVNQVSQITQADSHVRMTFNRELSEAEQKEVTDISAVGTFTHQEKSSYLVSFNLQGQDHDQAVAEIVKKLVEFGVVPRSIEAGVDLESRFLEMTGQSKSK